MKHLKKHPIHTDKYQRLSKDMEKQNLVNPKRDKKLFAEDSLSDVKVSKRYRKPSNKRLSSEKSLSDDFKAKKAE